METFSLTIFGVILFLYRLFTPVHTVRGMKKRNERDRVLLNLRRLGMPEIVLVGRNFSNRAQPPLRPHRHRGLFEIVVLDSGVQTYFVGQTRYDLKARDVFIAKPDEQHGTGTEPETKGLFYWLEFKNIPSGKSFLTLPANETKSLMRAFHNLPVRLFNSGDLLVPTFERIFAAYADTRNPLRALEIRSLVLRLLLDVISITDHEVSKLYSAGVQRAVRLIERNFEESFTVPQLAQTARMSESYFKTVFKRETGLPPIEYILWQRIECAKRLLQTSDQPITRIAIDLGFATSQHFATVFKRLAGLTPRAFRRQASEHI